MRYCSECELVTRETDSTTCPACGAVLRSMDELPDEDRDRPVVLTFCESLYEAQVLRAALGAEDIEAMVEDEGLLEMLSPYTGSADPQRSTRVMVRLEDAEAALEFLRRKEAGELAISEDDVPAEDASREDEIPGD